MSDQNEKDDKEGRLSGWSLASGIDNKSLEDLLELPCYFQFKAIAKKEGEIVADLLSNVAVVIGRDLDSSEYSVRNSNERRYIGLSIRLKVVHAQQIYDIYAALKKDSRVILVL
jgi:putative lipoic acid-binding regulatory protein